MAEAGTVDDTVRFVGAHKPDILVLDLTLADGPSLLIALGHTNGEIAQQLFLSVRTVETHRAHIQQKLRLSKRSELVRYALDKGLVESQSTAF